MSINQENKSFPIDAVVLWVDGDDPVLAAKRNKYLKLEGKDSKNFGAQPTRFASNNEIRYNVLSLFRFAPFIRNLFIITDGQDPDLYDDIKRYFPHRLDSIRIVDHKEIFRGYEEYLPVFNSTAIEAMMWRIDGLSEHFVNLNDDFILIRDIVPEDWFIDGKPVLKGKWKLKPFKKIVSVKLKRFWRTKILRTSFSPKFSFLLGQWYTATMLGRKATYFFNCHAPYVMRKSTLENFFKDNPNALNKNISSRFRAQEKYNITSLSNHLELKQGKRKIIKTKQGYLDPAYYSEQKMARKMRRWESNDKVKSVCIQSLDMIAEPQQQKILDWVWNFFDME